MVEISSSEAVVFTLRLYLLVPYSPSNPSVPFLPCLHDVSLVNSVPAPLRSPKHPTPFHDNAARRSCPIVLFAKSQHLRVKGRNAYVTSFSVVRLTLCIAKYDALAL
jgi:hypothetical protein